MLVLGRQPTATGVDARQRVAVCKMSHKMSRSLNRSLQNESQNESLFESQNESQNDGYSKDIYILKISLQEVTPRRFFAEEQNLAVVTTDAR